METGWIKISRALRNHWLWQNPRQLQWWLDLLMSAQYRDTKMRFGNSLVVIARGQLAASIRDLCNRWSYIGEDRKPHTPSTKTVSSFLKTLESDGMISKEMLKLPNRETLITICNYDAYQGFEEGSENTWETLGKHLGNTIKEIIEVDEVNGARAYTREENPAAPAEPNTVPGAFPPGEKESLNRVSPFGGESQEVSGGKGHRERPLAAAEVSTQAQNQKYLQRYFAPNNLASLEGRTKHLHTLNPAINTIEDFRNLARACLDEWELRGEPPKPNYKEWASHLIRHAEVKARTTKNINQQNTDPYVNPNQSYRPAQATSYADARQRGEDEFAAFAAAKLRSAGLS